MHRTSRLAIVFLAGLVLGSFQNGAMVLCYGADGHVEVERVGHNHCEHDGGHSGDAGASEGVAKDCRPCVDVEAGWAAEARVSEKGNAGYVGAVMAVFGGQIESSHPVGHPAHYTRKAAFEEGLRSVVLVI